MEIFFLAMALSALAVQAPDTAAAARSGVNPKNERQIRAYEERVRREGLPKKELTGMAKVLANYNERAAARSNAKQSVRLERIQAKTPEVFRRKLDKRDAHLDKAKQAGAQAAGRAWQYTITATGKTADKVREARAKRLEREQRQRKAAEQDLEDRAHRENQWRDQIAEVDEDAAWEENRRRDEQTAEDAAPVAKVLPFERRDTDPTPVPAAAGKSGESTTDPGENTSGTPTSSDSTEGSMATTTGSTEDNGTTVTSTNGDNYGVQAAVHNGTVNGGSAASDPAPDASPESGGSSAPAAVHSGEITNHTEALSYCQAMKATNSEVMGTIEAIAGSVNPLPQGYERQLAHLEVAIGNLTQHYGEGSQGPAHLSVLKERYAQLRERLNTIVDQLAQCQEDLTIAGEFGAKAERFFQSQAGLAEQVQTHTDRAKTTGFYAGG